MDIKTIYLYEDRRDVTLTTYILPNFGELPADMKRPAVLICPGGGYFNCSFAEGEPIALKFASMGYHAFVLQYSTYLDPEKGELFPDLSKEMDVREKCLYPNSMREIGQSFLIIHEHADEWNVDTSRIAVCGFSAGGHNAAMYATHWHEEVITDFFGEDKEKFRPAAAILGYPLTDYVYKKEEHDRMGDMPQAFFKKSDKIFLGSENPTDEQRYEVSPALHVSEFTPPMFLWATSQDELVPVQHSLLMAKSLADHKIPFEVHVFEEGMHGLALSTQATAMARSQIKPAAAQWADLAGRWLEKRFALPLPDKTAFEVELGL